MCGHLTALHAEFSINIDAVSFYMLLLLLFMLLLCRPGAHFIIVLAAY